jgi:DNA-binding CsgD family transcriptional regulator
MREDDMLLLSVQCARLAVTGARYESVLADGVAAILGTDAGTGVTTWYGTSGDPDAGVEVVVSGVAPLTSQEKAAGMGMVPRHPIFGSQTITDPTHRFSDVISLPAFWDTDPWQVMHSHGNGRYPAAVIMRLHHRAAVIVGVQRTRLDFDADDMATLDLLRKPLAAALTFRAALEDASHLCRAVIGPPNDPLTPREEQVIGMVALGWTNTRIARHFQISQRTVRKHLENINEKLGTDSRAAAVYQWQPMAHRLRHVPKE